MDDLQEELDRLTGEGTAASRLAEEAPSRQAYKPVLQLSKAELDEMVKQADDWIDNPDQMTEWALKKLLIVTQLVGKVATTIPGGRGGPNSMLRAATLYTSLAEKAMAMAERAKDAKGK